MSGRVVRRLAVCGLVASFGLLPLSSAHAAPAARTAEGTAAGQLQALGQRVLQSFIELLPAQWAPVEAMSSHHPPGQHPGTDPRDGVGIDPHGKPGR